MTEVSGQLGGVSLPARAYSPGTSSPLPLADTLGAFRRGVDAVTQAAHDGAGVVARGIRTLSSPRGLVGTAVETAWCAAHLAVYPWGLITDQHYYRHGYGLDELTPTQRGLVIGDVEAAATPILLVHGMVDNRSIFTLLRRGLHRRGFGRVVTTNYSPFTNDVRGAAAQLAANVEELVADTGYERIHVVGHSLGGLIARYYVQRLGGHERVHTLVTLGTPHLGTRAAYLWPANLGRQLRPGSDLMEELAQPAPECTTRFLSYWSDLDQMIVPKRNARVVHPDLQRRNRLVRGVGHMSLPIKGRLVHEITNALSQLDTDGTTLTEGVTALQTR
ncbi:MAG TPA: alpha/beta fold hydrolase [Actinomycetales bacterium]|nr:alpha/beta fold hydrolase [Actinomycetales bacterium]